MLEYLNLVSDLSDDVTLCTGSLGSLDKNYIVDMIKTFKDTIFFVHIRNVNRFDNGDFIESSHRACDGFMVFTT
jgi:mannonate dehydratase